MYDVTDGEIGTELLKRLEKGGLIGLGYMDAGSRSFYSKVRPITQPADLKGLKIRVMQNPIFVQMVNSMGGNGTPVAFNELYTALQTGVVDGAENNLPSFFLSRHYEVSRYYTMDEHTWVPDVLLISTHVWERLSDEERGWLEEAVASSVIEQRRLWREASEQALDRVRAAGVEIIDPDRTAFRRAARSMLDSYRGTPVGDLVVAIEQVR